MSDPKIGLALGGGSARGLAHIPFLEVFDELGIKPAVIAGCSIGALVGAAYASGMPARDMADYARQVLVNKRSAAKFLFSTKGARIRTLLTLKNIASLQIDGERLAGFVLPEAVADRIEDTVIPLKIVTTDFETLSEHVLTRGPMARAIAASFAVPGIISAPVIDGHVHVDGGVTNPVPFDHVRDGMDIVVAIDVTNRPRPARRRHHSNFELGLGSMLIMFRQIAELRRSINPPDIYIEPPIGAFKATEFFRAHEMLEAAGQAKDDFKHALENRIRESQRR